MSVGLLVSHDHEPSKNSRTGRDSVWDENLGGPGNHALDVGPRDGPIVRQKGAGQDMSGHVQQLIYSSDSAGAVLVWCGLWSVAWYCGGQGTLGTVCHTPPKPINSYINYSFFITCST